MDNKPRSSFEWAGLDQTQKREKDLKMMETAKLCARVFGTEDGQKLFKWLIEKFKDVTVASPNAGHDLAYFKEGQRDVVRYLEKLISISKE